MAQPIVCEYFIQNDEYDSNHKHNPYPNVFLLPQKYNNITDVRVSDIISAFPLSNSDPLHKYVLRFETVLQISATKRINAWMDLENQLDIAVPSVKGKIRIKALRLPKGIEPKQIPSQPRYHKQSDSHPNSNRASSLGMQQQQKPPQNPYPQQQQQQQPHQYMYQQPKQQEQKSSFPDLTSVFQKVGGLFYGQEEQKEEFPRQTNANQSNKNFPQQQQFQQEQQQKQKQQTFPEQKQEFHNLFDDHDNHQNIPTEGNAWDKFDNFGQSQNTNLLFTDGGDDDNTYQQMNNQAQQPSSDNTGGFNIFDDDDVPTANQGTYQAPNFGNFASSDLLGDINFGPDPAQQPTQDPTQGKGGEKATSLQGSGGSRIDHVQAIFQAQQQQKVNWEKAYQQHEERINNWIGRGPMKNHVRVLLCTLDQVLWHGNGWERVGMDKLLDPQKVKLYYRKATMLCHPDKLGNSEENPDKVYIANRCFAALTEAYNIFKKEEGIN